jgi:hypothetical protein
MCIYIYVYYTYIFIYIYSIYVYVYMFFSKLTFVKSSHHIHPKSPFLLLDVRETHKDLHHNFQAFEKGSLGY